jgi:hypothetical protein
MDIPINAAIRCTNGPGGHSTYIVVNLTTEMKSASLSPRSRLIAENVIYLKLDKRQIEALPVVQVQRKRR